MAPRPITDAITVTDLMHATPHRRPFNRPGWIFEHKLDGYRAFVRKSGDRIELLSRHGRAMAAAFPEIVRALATLPNTDAVLDAELVVPDRHGFPSFEKLRGRAVMKRPISIAAAAVEHPAALCVFDCLVLDGNDMRALPLLERKAALGPLIADIPGLQVVTHGDGRRDGIRGPRWSLDWRGWSRSRLIRLIAPAVNRLGSRSRMPPITVKRRSVSGSS